MTVHKLVSTDGFIAFDYEDAPSVGVVRAAPKILQNGAKHLARSITYSFASFEIQRAGASAGVNAKPDDRAAAIKAFVDEVGPMVEEGRFFPNPAKGVTADDLRPLRDADGRNPVALESTNELVAAGVAVTAERALGGLDGRTVLIEGFETGGAEVAAAVAERGAKVVGIATDKASHVSADGLDLADLGPAGDRAELFSQPADLLVAGSKMGAIGHDVAASLSVGALVANGPVPFTARALAILSNAGTTVMPDFLSLAGPLLAAWPDGDGSLDAVKADVAARIGAALDAVVDHEEGPFLGASYRAEAYLRTWQEKLPFGRPLAP